MGLSAPHLKGKSSFKGKWDPLAAMKTGTAIPIDGKAAIILICSPSLSHGRVHMGKDVLSIPSPGRWSVESASSWLPENQATEYKTKKPAFVRPTTEGTTHSLSSFMLWSTDIPNVVLLVPASVISHIALPDFGRMNPTILLQHHSTSVLFSAGQGRVLGTLFAWVRRRLIELRSSISNPDQRKCLCLSGHYTLHLSVISPLLQLTSDQIWQASFCVFTFSLSFLRTNAHTTHWLVYLYSAYRLSSLMNALKRSEYSACIANQHQLCSLTAPDVSSKMNCICSAVHRSNACKDETRLLNGPSEPGLWTCIANATSPSAKKGLAFSPRTCCSS